MDYSFITVEGKCYLVPTDVVRDTVKNCQEHAIAHKTAGSAVVIRKEDADMDVISEAVHDFPSPTPDSESAEDLVASAEDGG